MTFGSESPSQPTNTSQRRQQQRRRWRTASTFGILWSSASTLYSEDLVSFERYTRPLAAFEDAQRITQSNGLEFEVMAKIDGQWLSRTGETPESVIRRRWTF